MLNEVIDMKGEIQKRLEHININLGSRCLDDLLIIRNYTNFRKEGAILSDSRKMYALIEEIIQIILESLPFRDEI